MTDTRMQRGRALYLAVYETEGAIWEANKCKDLWCKKADRYLELAAPQALAATPADVLERIAKEQFSDPATDDLTVPLAIELSEMTTRAFKAEAALRAATPAVIDRKMIETVIGEFAIDNRELSYLEMEPEEFSRRIMEKIKAKPTATPAVAGEIITNDWVLKMLQWSPMAQFDVAFKLAENVGYTLVREAEHPDSPHSAAQPASPLRGREATLLRDALQQVYDFMLEDHKSGDSGLWTEPYAELFDVVDAALSASPPEQPAADPVTGRDDLYENALEKRAAQLAIAAVSKVVSRRDDMGNVHFVELSAAILDALSPTTTELPAARPMGQS